MASTNSGGRCAAGLARAAHAIESQFSELAPVRLEPVAGGEDFNVFLANGKWIFRFPRRRSSESKLQRERLLLPRIAAVLKSLCVRIPCYKKTAMPSPQFPWPFAGYMEIPGVAADRVAPEKLNQRQLARVLGRAIGRLHLMDCDTLTRAGVPGQPTTPRRVMVQLRAREHSIRQAVPPALWHTASDFLSGKVAVPRAYRGPARFLHNDICPDHILVDPLKGRLNGLIDFSDAALGDPALDFANLYSWLGRSFVLDLLRWYDAPRDPEFEMRVAFFARTLSLLWLADAARKGDKADVSKHIRWVRRAFRD